MAVTRSVVTRLAAVAALALVVSTLAACDVVGQVAGPRTWTQEAELQDGSTQTITVRDTSGRIAEVEIDPPGVQDPGVIVNPDGDLQVVLVPWTGGACDTQTDIEFAAAGDGLAGTITIQTSGDVCVMMAVPHLLRLSMNAPTPADQVTLTPAS